MLAAGDLQSVSRRKHSRKLAPVTVQAGLRVLLETEQELLEIERAG